MTALEIYENVFGEVPDAGNIGQVCSEMELIRDAKTLAEAREAIDWWDCWRFEDDMVGDIIKVRKLWGIKEKYCLSCGEFIRLCEYGDSVGNGIECPPEADNWHDGLVDTIVANYGSSHDGDMFLIAVCDKCLTRLRDSGRIEFIKNVFMGEV